ncbi:hypothetical protein ACH41H_36365 [Streptomyces sp. NPDC020800]|uniref:hypothetical protein n=1 Tax=Streptomyces sp. NPDC020800 TaxID=3365092 RepID=UPI00379D0F2F
MTEPLSPEREQEIRESIPTVYGPPWTLEPDMEDGTWLVMYATDHPLAGLVAVIPDYGAHLAEFIATARAAVPELLDEIERLRAVLGHITVCEIPWPGHPFPLWLQRSYAGGDRWWIGDREGRRWNRDHGFVFERQDDERTRTDTRFPLADAWSLARRIATGEVGP